MRYWINWLQSMKKCSVRLILCLNLLERSYLAMLLSSAINSKNPLESMQKQLTDLRKAKTHALMLSNITAFYRTGEAFTKEFLTLLLKQKEYSHFTNRIN